MCCCWRRRSRARQRDVEDVDDAGPAQGPQHTGRSDHVQRDRIRPGGRRVPEPHQTHPVGRHRVPVDRLFGVYRPVFGRTAIPRGNNKMIKKNLINMIIKKIMKIINPPPLRGPRIRQFENTTRTLHPFSGYFVTIRAIFQSNKYSPIVKFSCFLVKSWFCFLCIFFFFLYLFCVFVFT